MVALLNGLEVSVQKRTTFPLVPLVRALNAGRKDIGAMVFIFTVYSSVTLFANPF
jgi:hypothetical protein